MTSLSPLADTGGAVVADARAKARAISQALRKAARKSRTPVSIRSGGGGFRARKGDKLFIRGLIISGLLLVALPLLVMSVYLPLIATDQYAIETKFAVRSSKQSPLDGLAGLAGLSTSEQTQDALIIASYIKSRAMVEELDRRFDLRSIYGRPSTDWWSRFDTSEPIEELVDYWWWRHSVEVDRFSGIMTVIVRTFDREESLKLGRAVVEISERVVNELANRSKYDAIARTERELRRAEARLTETTTTMRDVRNRLGVLDVTAKVQGLTEVTGTLRLELAKIDQEIAVTQGAVSPDAPQQRVLRARAASLRAQIDEYDRSIAGATQSAVGGTLSASASELDRVRIEMTVAQDQYATAVAAYERARIQLQTKGAYLLTFLAPSLPEQALYPKRWFWWSVIVLPFALAWAMLVGIAYLVRDYMAK